jgi:hypothetical protein
MRLPPLDDLRVPAKNLEIEAVAAAFIMSWHEGDDGNGDSPDGTLGRLTGSAAPHYEAICTEGSALPSALR